MKKVINGKMYNTKTAKLIGNYWYRDYDDFYHLDEDLYQKRTGEFFIHGKGGAATEWAEDCGNASCAGSGIKPLTLDEAKQWAEEHLDGDKYVEVFGEVEE